MNDQIKGELISFKTKDGLILNGFLVRARTKSSKAVIHIHGLEGTFYRSHLAKVLAKKLAGNGFNFLSIELRGSYTSLGIRRKTGKKLTWFSGGGGFEKFEECIYDISGAIRFLNGMGMKKIYLEGHSTGCQKITYYQYKKKDRRVKALVLLGPADDYNIEKRALGRKFNQAVKDANTLYKKDKYATMPKKYLKRIFGAGRFLSISDQRFVESRIFNYELPKLVEFNNVRRPVLVIFGSKDESATRPVNEHMEILKRDSGSTRFDHSIIKGADHGFTDKENKTANLILKWLDRIR